VTVQEGMMLTCYASEQCNLIHKKTPLVWLWPSIFLTQIQTLHNKTV